MTTTQSIIILAVVSLGTAITRFLPFILFPDEKRTPKYIKFLGSVLPYAVMGMLVVYCLKGVSFVSSPFGIPEAAALIVTVALHLWKKNTLLSIAAGTAVYMILIQSVF